MSLIAIFKKKENKKLLFTTPSHGQSFFLVSKLRNFYKHDISETQAHNPQEALVAAEKEAAKIYKTKSTHFLTNGSTSGIIASVLASCDFKKEQKQNILINKGAHRSHQSAVKLSGANPIFYQVEKDVDWGVDKETSAEVIEHHLKENFVKNPISAVIITSPTYEGVVSDIKKIKKICEKYKTFLIVDEAHGALYPFCEKLPQSAIYQGADFVIQSLHKTAAGLNPTALLHCNCDGMDVEKALSLITTTSPSYPLLMSIEKNIKFLNSTKGRKKIEELVENIDKIKKELKGIDFYKGDSTKILFKIKGLSGEELSEILYEKCNIEDEIVNEKSVMLLCGLGTDLKKLTMLKNRLKKVFK